MALKEITDISLAQMVASHYDNEKLTQLKGEIAFDDKLSAAEIDAALRAFHEITGRQLPPTVYAPMAGPLRHVEPLLNAGVENVIAVDLSQGSLDVGLNHYGNRLRPDGTSLEDHVVIYCTDVRKVEEFIPPGGVELAVSLGNSFGDVTDPVGHQAVMQAMADALAEGGAFVFDYVGPRYNPKRRKRRSIWEDVHVANDGTETAVYDIRTRSFRRSQNYESDGTGILSFTCRVRENQGKWFGLFRRYGREIVPFHTYEKLVVPDTELERQFAAVGLKLVNLGPITCYSEYHRRRNAEKGDLGMMGDPDHLYVAVKDSSLVQGKGGH